MRFIDDQSFEKLNIQKILDRIELQCSYGKDNLKEMQPYRKNQHEALLKEFNLIKKLKECYLENKKLFGEIEKKLEKLKNIKKIVEYSKSDYIYDDTDFYELKIQGMLFEELEVYLNDIPKSLNDIPKSLNEVSLNDLSLNEVSLSEFKLESVKKIVDLLDPNNDRVPTFHIYNFYSKKLAGIREKKKEIEQEIYRTEDRETLDKLKENRLSCVVNENTEEIHVRKNLMDELKSYMSNFEKNIEIVGRLDLLLGKVKLAIKYNGCFPKISSSNRLIGEGLINLELGEILKKKGKEIVPIDIILEQGSNLITGANMGGKSIALKTIAENMLMFHYGLFPIGKKAEFPMVDFIFFISDDMQDLSKGLSTFGAEIIKLKEISIFIERGQGILFFDEFARGTNPEEGRRFARSLLKYMSTKDSISLMTTHFDGVAQENINHYQVVGLKNIDFERLKLVMELKKNSLSMLQEYMDYRLERTADYSVPKYAMNIGVLLGMNNEFLKILQEEYKED